MRLLILGANGFIGSHLIETILATTDWEVAALDLASDKIQCLLPHPRFNFQQGDMTLLTEWVTDHIKAADVVLPLAAVATPATYVQNPLRVFELDFEANLKIVRLCQLYQKRVIFPSTSEVYGMSLCSVFDEETTPLVTGPIAMERWIYSSSKQLMDRIIYAMGKHQGLSYTLFRPFNWYGPRLDNVFNAKAGASRVLTQFIGNVIRGENIHLVNGGAQKRCFTYIDDGIAALLKIIENKEGLATNKIFNIGNPHENFSIRQLAEMLCETIIENYPQHANNAKKTELIAIEAENYFGQGYQDVAERVPSITRIQSAFNWQPLIDLHNGLKKTLDFYLI